MDQTASAGLSFEEEKKKLYRQLLEQILTSFEAKQIDIKTMKDTSAYLLDNLPSVKDKSSLVVFLEELKKRWNIFNQLAALYTYSAGVHTEAEKDVIDKLSGYIKSFQN